MTPSRTALFAVIALLAASSARAQDNYEIQVYGAETVAPHNTMVEVHSNFTINGSKKVEDGVLPANHAMHETLEITQESTTGLKLDSTSSPAFSPTEAGSGWAITSAPEFAFQRNGTGRSA